MTDIIQRINVRRYLVIMDKKNIIYSYLKKVQPHAVLPKKFLEGEFFVFDFTKKNKVFSKIDLHDTRTSSRYIHETLGRSRRRLGIGKYGEERTIYQSPIYKTNGEARTIHLAIDLFVPAGTAIFAPLDGIVHSFQDNNHFLDYGPTIILEHHLEGIRFYTLYGHLSRSSLKKISAGQKVRAGEKIAVVGRSNVNGNWPPHLHFQIIMDLLGYKGDFPGVARPSEKEYYFRICPDPNIILQLPT